MSGSVFLNNLDDYILPSQECVVVAKSTEPAPSSGSKRIALKIENDPEPFVGKGIIKSMPASLGRLSPLPIDICQYIANSCLIFILQQSLQLHHPPLQRRPSPLMIVLRVLVALHLLKQCSLQSRAHQNYYLNCGLYKPYIFHGGK